jgi:hypothetical protein
MLAEALVEALEVVAADIPAVHPVLALVEAK